MSLTTSVKVRLGDFIEDLSLRVEDGEVVAMLGPNGSGKSTFVRALAGLQPLDAGHITLGGRVLDDPDRDILVPSEKRRCAVVFQSYLLFPNLNARDNVAFGLRAERLPRREANRRAMKWLARLGLESLADVKPSELSGGQAQRVALARALATEPEVLLLDEPMAALDVQTRDVVRAELRGHLADFGGPCVLVTHDPVDAIELADRLVVIEAGRVVQEGSAVDLAADPRTSYVKALLGRAAREELARPRPDGQAVSRSVRRVSREPVRPRRGRSRRGR